MPQTPDEFLNLLQPHYRSALQYCRALCREPNDAQDLLQQALVLALEKLPGLRDPTRFKAWFFQIITRAFYRQCRQKFWRCFLPLESTNHTFELENDQPDFPVIFPGTEEPTNERRTRLLEALAKLRPKERAALLLFELGDFTIADIAEIQEEKSLSAIKSRLSRTRQKLKDLILTAEKNKEKIINPTKEITHEIEKMAALFTGRR
ncbi:RNA polymerase sigma factor [Adhaeribacter swui]|uniref:RNA polymerase sigma factor n=1 Tax=Adhaeribacter swui TaxID=2086471 RepID=A0A7G7GC60_9BACT|nr:RNA polymerase sigma factor [Adhaeribacter swui]QNF34744.1 RNA polymerase sigma factor [Adhaeribacter swui]